MIKPQPNLHGHSEPYLNWDDQSIMNLILINFKIIMYEMLFQIYNISQVFLLKQNLQSSNIS